MNKHRNHLFITLWAIALLLPGCGQKGDLYIPQPQPEIPVTEEQEEENQ